MLEALLGQAKTLFGKTFLIAGVLPAAVFLFFLNWYLLGSLDAVGKLISETFADSTKLTASAIFAAGELLALALILFASRAFFFYLVEHLPIRPVRARLILRQIKRRRIFLAVREKALSDFNSARWASRGEFIRLKNVEVTETLSISEVDLLRRSAESRDLVKRGAAFLARNAPYDIKLTDIDRVGVGLHGLYVHLHKNDQPSKAMDTELREWRSLAAIDTTKHYLDLLTTTVRRRFNESIADTEKFPRNDLWIKPTAFGNRLSALNDYSKARYGIATSVLWPRLWRILTAEERTEISDKQLLIEAHLNLGVVSILFLSILLTSTAWRTVSTLREYGWGSSFDRVGLCFGLGSLILAAIAYFGAVFALGSFAESVKSLIDLRTLQLLPAVGYKPPFTVASERELLGELEGFFLGSAPREKDRELIPLGVAKPEVKKEASDQTT